MIDEPAPTHHNRSKSIVYLWVHSYCCTFYGFGQRFSDRYPSLWYHTEYFHCPKNTLCSACSSPTSPTLSLWLSLTSLLFPQFSLLQNVLQLESYSMQPFQVGFFHLVMCIQVSFMPFHGLIGHFFFMPNTVPLSGCITVYLSIHLLKSLLPFTSSVFSSLPFLQIQLYHSTPRALGCVFLHGGPTLGSGLVPGARGVSSLAVCGSFLQP